jgi:hypothetical protein
MFNVSILELTGCYVTGGTATINVTARMLYVIRTGIIVAISTEITVV